MTYWFPSLRSRFAKIAEDIFEPDELELIDLMRDRRFRRHWDDAVMTLMAAAHSFNIWVQHSNGVVGYVLTTREEAEFQLRHRAAQYIRDENMSYRHAAQEAVEDVLQQGKGFMTEAEFKEAIRPTLDARRRYAGKNWRTNGGESSHPEVIHMLDSFHID